ncbi:DUF167 domain-containing protein [bacterium]|nr:DUF167 domain-containing protein [bacterium]
MTFQVSFGSRGATFEVKVQPGAGSTAILGTWESALKMKLAKKPENGAANRECLEYLSRWLGISHRNLKIIKGEFSRRKVIRVDNLTAEQVQERLREVLS